MSLFNRKANKQDDQSMQHGVGLITVYKPKSTISEQFKTLRTNILFSNADKQIKSLVITSSGVSEGKSTVSANVAVTFANQGLRTLLLDADTRRPTVHATFSMSNDKGLVNLLTEKADRLPAQDYIISTSVENLSVLPTGPVPPNPSELLSSHRMTKLIEDLTAHFDMVIFDAPPVGSVTDAQIIASKCDATILVVPFGIAQKAAVMEAKSMLDNVDANIIGVVQNRIPAEERGYYGYGYGYGYYGSEVKEK
ncbi:CpsD/CapB family tyrosine-protein kinase [Lacticaseibacillus sp. GG6-2]